MHHTKTQGDYAEFRVAAEFIKKGYVVSRPLSDYSAYDLIVDTGTELLKVQVKARSMSKGAITVTNGTSNRTYADDAFDMLACLCIDTDEIALFKKDDLPGTANVFRIEESKNNQSKGVRFFKDYLI